MISQDFGTAAGRRWPIDLYRREEEAYLVARDKKRLERRERPVDPVGRERRPDELLVGHRQQRGLCLETQI